MEFHERIRYLRTRAGLTQEQLALKAGATGNMETLWERPRTTGGSVPRYDTLAELCIVLDTNGCYLLGLTDDARPTKDRDEGAGGATAKPTDAPPEPPTSPTADPAKAARAAADAAERRPAAPAPRRARRQDRPA